MKTGKCSNCGFVGQDTHLHHIVPRSRGGRDTKENLIELCTDCHGKAHNVSFDGTSGVISDGINKSKFIRDELKVWLNLNEDVVHEILMDFYETYDTDVLTEMFYFNAINLEDFYTFMFYGKSYKKGYFGEIPSMLSSLVRNGEYNVSRCNFMDDILSK
ncbi:putative endonuclease [Acinetobacter phage BS46]|nr:putative endonuclease [Acinetobacter phage BS46]